MIANMKKCVCERARKFYCQDCGENLVPEYTGKRCIYCGGIELSGKYVCKKREKMKFIEKALSTEHLGVRAVGDYPAF